MCVCVFVCVCVYLILNKEKLLLYLILYKKSYYLGWLALGAAAIAATARGPRTGDGLTGTVVGVAGAPGVGAAGGGGCARAEPGGRGVGGG